jgi:hypothetical protein
MLASINKASINKACLNISRQSQLIDLFHLFIPPTETDQQPHNEQQCPATSRPTLPCGMTRIISPINGGSE